MADKVVSVDTQVGWADGGWLACCPAAALAQNVDSKVHMLGTVCGSVCLCWDYGFCWAGSAKVRCSCFALVLEEVGRRRKSSPC